MLASPRTVLNGKFLKNGIHFSPKLYSKHRVKGPTNYGHTFNENFPLLKSVQSWSKSTFVEFTEKLLILRFEHLLEKTTYMQDMRKSKDHMLAVQKQLVAAGEKKRNIIKKLEDVRSRINVIYKDMKTCRIKESHMDMARDEIDKLCNVEQYLSDMYNQVDREEQSLQSESFLAIKDAYEKEKNHTKFIRVISLLGAFTTSILALIVSTLMQNQKHNDLAARIETLRGQNSQNESWGSYLHRNVKWTYSWINRFR